MDVSQRIVSSYTYPRFVSIRTYYLLLPSPLPGTEIQFLAKSFFPTCGVQSSKGNVEFLLPRYSSTSLTLSPIDERNNIATNKGIIRIP